MRSLRDSVCAVVCAAACLAACAEGRRDAYTTDTTDPTLTQPSGDFGRDAGKGPSTSPCTKETDCPAGWTCDKSGSGELRSAICVPPVQHSYSPWTDWSSCGASCAGSQSRTRSCMRNDGAVVDCSLCGGACSESRACDTLPSCTPDTFHYSPWTDWSSCGTSCTGSQSRTRSCLRDADSAAVDCSLCGGVCSENRACDAQPSCHPAQCVGTPWGTVADGFSQTAYLSESPTGPCVSQVRTCTNGSMSGSYTATTCHAGCTGTPWGDVPSGYSGNAYRLAIGTSSSTCASMMETRTCVDGTMSGTYTHTACTNGSINYPCELGGALFPVLDAAFAGNTFPSTWRECHANGTWGPPQHGNPTALGAPCEWSGSYFENTTCGYYNGTTYQCRSGPSGPTWEATTGCPAP